MVAAIALVASAAVAFADIAPSGHDAKRARRYVVESREFAPLPGSVHIEARADDPGGDAPWVLRIWRLRDDTQACVQLGRLVNGTVGDVGADGQFRALKLGERTSCSSRVFDFHAPISRVATFLDDPLARDARPLRTVSWGMAGPRAASVTVTGPDGAKTAAETPVHAWIDVRDGNTRTYQVATTVRYRDGTTRTIDYGSARRRSRQPLPGSVTIEARVKSPDGGPDFGLLAWRTQNGSSCSTDGRLLGADRVGAWAPDGSFFDYPIGEGGACRRVDRDSLPLPVGYSYGWSIGSPGRFSGFARPDVAAVIVEGIGTRRELTPGPSGGVLALFPAREGRLTVSARFDDGRLVEMPPLRIPRFRRPAPRPQITRVGPKLATVTRAGRFTVLVSCAENSGRTRGSCMTSLSVRTAEGHKRPQGLTRYPQLATRLVRIGAGARERPLQLRLNERGRTLLRRHHSLDVIVSAPWWPNPTAPIARSRASVRIRLVENAARASADDVTVEVGR